MTAGFAQMSELPGSVRMFLDEREMMNSLVLKKNDKDAAMLFKSRFAPTRVIGGKEMADVSSAKALR